MAFAQNKIKKPHPKARFLKQSTLRLSAWDQPWRALNRRWVLLITYTRPLRRTTRQSRWRFLSERSELRTFMAVSSASCVAPVRRGHGVSVGHVGRTQRSEFGMVGDTGIEPVTPSMSTKCSTAELIARTVRLPTPNKWGAESRASAQGYKRSRNKDQGLLAST